MALKQYTLELLNDEGSDTTGADSSNWPVTSSILDCDVVHTTATSNYP